MRQIFKTPPLRLSCSNGHVSLLLDRGCSFVEEGSAGSQPLGPALFAYGMACSSSERTGSQTVSKAPEVRAAQVAHPAASTSAHDPPRPRPCVWPCELVWRRAWSSKANKRKDTRRPGGRVVCTGIDNPGSNVFPASRPVWQWGGTRYNFYLQFVEEFKSGYSGAVLRLRSERVTLRRAMLHSARSDAGSVNSGIVHES